MEETEVEGEGGNKRPHSNLQVRTDQCWCLLVSGGGRPCSNWPTEAGLALQSSGSGGEVP